MDDCIFCKIIKGEIPSYKVYEDDNVYAFLDIAPISYGHTLVISKKHYVNIETTPEKNLKDLIVGIKKVGKAIKESLGVEGYNVCENNNPVAGQIIPHIHFHVVPRRKNDGLAPWSQGKYGDGEADEIAEKIKNQT